MRVQLGASQRSWHGALFRLDETRFEEAASSSIASPESQVSRTAEAGRKVRASGKTHFRSYRRIFLRID